MQDYSFSERFDRFPLAMAYVPWQHLTSVFENLDEAYKLALESYINNLKKTLIQISVKDVKSATSYFYKAAKKLPDGEKENIGLFLEDIEDLSDILEQYNFREADKLFQIKRVISKNEY